MPDRNETECVCVLNGIHRSAVIEVGEEPVSLGGPSDCACVLADASVADNSVELSLNEAGDLVVMLRDGDASVGARALRPEKPVVLAKGAVLRMGDVRIAVGSHLPKAQRDVRLRDRRRRALNWGTAVAASLVLVGGMGALGWGAAGAYIATGETDRASFAPVVRRSDADITAATALQSKVDEASLGGAIAVERLALSEQIKVTGAVSPEERRRWNGVARWFDGQFGGRVMLETDIRDRDAELVVPFRIASVVMAPNPRIVIQDGRVFPVGAVLPGGWEIRGIADMKVILTKGNRELKIAF